MDEQEDVEDAEDDDEDDEVVADEEFDDEDVELHGDKLFAGRIFTVFDATFAIVAEMDDEVVFGNTGFV